MADIFDYLSWRGDLTFAQSSFNPVDNIILTHLSYIPLDNAAPGPEQKKGVTIAEAAELFNWAFEKSPGDFRDILISKEDPRFFGALGSSGRYGNLELRGYVNQLDPDREKQFAALTILTGDGSAFITYRGTDATLVGWKEDFNMSFSAAVPAQLEAVAYLEEMAKQIRGPLRIGGHSKGGNLAVYAAAFCHKKIQSRITAIYSNDAPGFHRTVMDSAGYRAIREKIISFVPQDSVIGMLFEHDDDYTVVKSTQAGLMQHDVYSWEVIHNDVVRLDRVTQGSRFIDRTLKEWIGSLDERRREQFTEALYAILSSTEAKSFPELGAGWLKNAGIMIQSLKDIDEQTRELIFSVIAALFKAAKNNINTLLPKTNFKKPAPPKFLNQTGASASGDGD
ncbi:MAG: DUF2974 domain-containing protein [Spirochaetaceae bacterium]|jgi:hypothetical protein|nr:DUF2974 domain-containing protein [Spirochaetaceae bacterium]